MDKNLGIIRTEIIRILNENGKNSWNRARQKSHRKSW